MSIAQWPSVRDVSRQLELSQEWINRLVLRGVIRAERTRVGWLLDPKSVAEFEAARAARKVASKR